MKKIMLICGASHTVLNFRSSLISALIENNCEVAVVALDSEKKDEIEKLGVKVFVCGENKNRDVSPFKLLKLKKNYLRIIREFRPDTVFTFMIKPNTFGALAAKKAGVKNIFSMVEGLGDVFINDGLKWKLIRRAACFLYKKSFKNCRKVFFLNGDDKAEFIKRKLVREEQCEIIFGIGVDLEKFAYKPIKAKKSFLMVARMIRNKGVFEFCECARKVKEKHPDAVFDYLGWEGNVKVADIKEYLDDGSVNYLGVTSDARPYYEECTALILPSYREGMPVSVMEAQATGRAVIVTNVAGCRETARDGYNGFIVPAANADALAEKAIFMIEHPEETRKMGENARLFAEENFDRKKINEKVLAISEKISEEQA